jgi:hypothetical protein
MYKPLIIAAIFWLGIASTASKTKAQGRTECLSYFDSIPEWVHGAEDWHPPFAAGNPDSVLVDTCTGSSTYGSFYARKWFRIAFRAYVIPLPTFPADTIVEVPWTAVDTSFSDLRAGLQTIEAKYGLFVLRKVNPEINDTANGASSNFTLRFASAVCVDSVVHALSSLPLMGGHEWRAGLKYLESGVLRHQDNVELPFRIVNGRLSVSPWAPRPVLLVDLLARRIYESHSETDIEIPPYVHGWYFLRVGAATFKMFLH